MKFVLDVWRVNQVTGVHEPMGQCEVEADPTKYEAALRDFVSREGWWCTEETHLFYHWATHPIISLSNRVTNSLEFYANIM